MRVACRVRCSMGSRRESERGAVVVMVAILSVVLLGFAAFAIDLGDSWQTRRHLITASDAAALAAAHDYAEGKDGCALSAGDFVQSNFPGATMEICQPNLNAGWVKVKVGKLVDWHFAAVLGRADQTVHSSTTARWGAVGATNHFVPIGICDRTPGLQQWLAAYTTGADALPAEGTPPITILLGGLGSLDVPGCFDAGTQTSGNFALLDFPNVPGNSMLRPCVDPAGSSSCIMPTVSPPAQIDAKTGASYADINSFVQQAGMGPQGCATNWQSPEREWNWIMPVYSVIAGANGATAIYTVTDFVAVDVYCMKVTGPGQFIQLRFKSRVTEGELSSGGGTGYGVSVVEVCGVDDSGSC